jgi:hypothetical protein
MPVTTPDVVMEALAALLTLHTPPVTDSVSGVVKPIHTWLEPVIVPASGNGLTVNAAVAVAVPQLVVSE